MTSGGTATDAARSAKLGELDCVVIRGVPAVELDAGVAEASELNAEDCVMAPKKNGGARISSSS